MDGTCKAAHGFAVGGRIYGVGFEQSGFPSNFAPRLMPLRVRRVHNNVRRPDVYPQMPPETALPAPLERAYGAAMMFRTALSATLLAAMVTIGACGPAISAKIGLVIPLEGPFALLGKQTQAGAEIAAAAGSDTLVVVEDTCTPDSGGFVARTLADEKVDIAVGFLCLETLAASLPVLKDAKIPVITTGVRADSLTDNREKNGFLINRLGPRDDSEAAALAAFLLPDWSRRNFAIIDDGTIHARDMAESFRAAAAEAGLKPVFTDTYRPGLTNQAALARRLQKAGATHVFIGGDMDDAVVISRDARDYGGLIVAMGESALPSDPAIEHGMIYALGLPDYSLRPEAAKANLALRNERIEPENYALLAHAAVEIAVQSIAAGKQISAGPYKTAIGDVRFDAKGDLAANPFNLMELRGTAFVPAKIGSLAGQ